MVIRVKTVRVRRHRKERVQHAWSTTDSTVVLRVTRMQTGKRRKIMVHMMKKIKERKTPFLVQKIKSPPRYR